MIEAVIRDAIAAWEKAFPDHIEGWYLLGSRADGTAVPASDVDLFFVLGRDAGSPEDARKAADVERALSRRHGVKVEAWGETLSFLQGLSAKRPVPRELIHCVSLKLGSRHLAGRDVRDEIPLPALDLYGEAFRAVAEGWSGERKRREADGVALRGHGDARGLARSIFACAALQAVGRGRVYLPTKSAVLGAFREHGEPRWLPLVEAAHGVLWQDWGYEIRDPAEAERLSREALEFERATLSSGRAALP